MRIIDLTQLLTEDMPVFPGDEPPVFEKVTTHEEDGYAMTQVTVWSHVGTHIDSPAHIIAGADTLDVLSIEQFVGKALIIDCYALGEGDAITMEYIDLVKDKADEADFLLFRTGWDIYWGTDEYYGEYPCIDDEVMQYLIDSAKKGMGIDMISPDPIESEELPIHIGLLENGIVILENLTNLNLCGDGLFTLCALPLKYIDSDGAQARVIAILEE